MTEKQTIIERQTTTEDVVPEHQNVERTTVVGGQPHGDEEAGGALAGGAAGAAAGAVVGGPVGAVVGGAIGATAGATAGAVDEHEKDDVVVTQEERRV
jgi:outer membrane lipoprotein SlyB